MHGPGRSRSAFRRQTGGFRGRCRAKVFRLVRAFGVGRRVCGVSGRSLSFGYGGTGYVGACAVNGGVYVAHWVVFRPRCHAACLLVARVAGFV